MTKNIKLSSLYDIYKRQYPLAYEAVMASKGWNVKKMQKTKSMEPILKKTKGLLKLKKLFIKSGESSILKDFAAGLEPTGVVTFQNAMKNKKRHGLHKTIGNIGGFLGGAAISPAAAALPTIVAGKLLKRKNPALGSTLEQSGKHLLHMYKPKSVKQVFRHGGKALRIGLNKKVNVENLEKNIRKVHTKGRFTASMRKSVASSIRDLKRGYKSSIDLEKRTGMKTDDLAQRTFSFIGGGASAAIGGSINSASANLQYSAGRRIGKDLELNKSKKSKKSKK